MKVLRQARNLGELRKQFDAIKSGVAGDTNFTAAALLWLCEHGNGNGATSPDVRAAREYAFVSEMRALRKAVAAFTKEQRTGRLDMMAQRRVEETLAGRIGVLESLLQLGESQGERTRIPARVEKS